MDPAPLAVNLEVKQPQELLERWYPNGQGGGLSVDGPLPGALGDECALTVHILGPPARRFQLVGKLAWARHKGSRGLRESFGVDLMPGQEGVRNRLLRFARRELRPEHSRSEERIEVELPVKVRVAGIERHEQLLDLSLGGAFVRSTSPSPVDTEVELELRPPRSLFKVKLMGRVAWVRTDGEMPGMGVEFHTDDVRTQQVLLRVLDHWSHKT